MNITITNRKRATMGDPKPMEITITADNKKIVNETISRTGCGTINLKVEGSLISIESSGNIQFYTENSIDDMYLEIGDKLHIGDFVLTITEE